MDKGISTAEARMLMETSSHLIDYIKLGFGTSFVSPNIEEKIKIYHAHNIKVYLGGTLFEAFYVRGMLDDYVKLVEKLGLGTIEVSDGSMVIDHDEKCELISSLSKNYEVLSEVGSKEAGILISPGKWIKMMTKELQAGSSKVIAEARESGTVGIYKPNGTAHTALIDKILSKVKSENILWEAPQKNQQVWFIKFLGANVNLGNIGTSDVIPLETLRVGLRGDTFFTFLPDQIKEEYK